MCRVKRSLIAMLALSILAVASHADEPVANLNSQIERFNKERPGAMGISPIERRVARVEWANKEEIAHCFDEKGAEFLTLKREADSRFRGVIEVPFRAGRRVTNGVSAVRWPARAETHHLA